MKELDMKRQIGFSVIRSTGWLAIAGAIGSVSAADFAMKDTAITDPARLDWAALSRDAQIPNAGRLDWTALSREVQMPNVGQLDWAALSRDTQRSNVAQLDWAGLSK
jgi:hypothetical protein